jgi:hypothetical protein
LRRHVDCPQNRKLAADASSLSSDVLLHHVGDLIVMKK